MFKGARHWFYQPVLRTSSVTALQVPYRPWTYHLELDTVRASSFWIKETSVKLSAGRLELMTLSMMIFWSVEVLKRSYLDVWCLLKVMSSVMGSVQLDGCRSPTEVRTSLETSSFYDCPVTLLTVGLFFHYRIIEFTECDCMFVFLYWYWTADNTGKKGRKRDRGRSGQYIFLNNLILVYFLSLTHWGVPVILRSFPCYTEKSADFLWDLVGCRSAFFAKKQKKNRNSPLLSVFSHLRYFVSKHVVFNWLAEFLFHFLATSHNQVLVLVKSMWFCLETEPNNWSYIHSTATVFFVYCYVSICILCHFNNAFLPYSFLLWVHLINRFESCS